MSWLKAPTSVYGAIHEEVSSKLKAAGHDEHARDACKKVLFVSETEKQEANEDTPVRSRVQCLLHSLFHISACLPGLLASRSTNEAAMRLGACVYSWALVSPQAKKAAKKAWASPTSTFLAIWVSVVILPIAAVVAKELVRLPM